MKNLVIAATVGVVSGALIAGCTVWQILSARHDSEVAQMLKASADAIAFANKEALTKERAARAEVERLEVQSNERKTELDALARENRRLAGIVDSGGLCKQTSSGVPRGDSAAVSADGTASAGNAAGTSRLAETAHRADLAAEYARTCYEWIKSLKQN